MLRVFLYIAGSAAILSTSAFAATINLSTGLDGGGTLQTTSGATDANWVMEGSGGIVSPGTHAQVVNSNSPDWYGGWAADGPNSSWIAANASVGNQGNLPYSYQVSFNLTAAEALTASLSSGSWGVDDDGYLQLNGTTISGPDHFNTNPGGINSFAGTNTGFVSGVNTLTIVTDGTDNDLEAARYEGSVSFTNSSTPEPASVFLMLSGLGAGLLTLRRRRQ